MKLAKLYSWVVWKILRFFGAVSIIKEFFVNKFILELGVNGQETLTSTVKWSIQEDRAAGMGLVGQLW